jgi:hypothetical protein
VNEQPIRNRLSFVVEWNFDVPAIAGGGFGPGLFDK